MDIVGIRPQRFEVVGNECIEDNINTMLRHLGHRDQDISHDWTTDLIPYGGYTEAVNSVSWIKEMRAMNITTTITPLLPETLNSDQRLVFDMIMDRFNNTNQTQLLMIVAGLANRT